MPTAFVLITTETGSESAVKKELEKIKRVKEAYVVYGVYDIIARISAESLDELREIIAWKIRRISDKIKGTISMIVVES